ncbi:MAG: PAS domain S-box protein [Dehalococcoidia bacterium]|nr:PAS domain S-box protein [Dehalococcoidia bacterium]
MNSKSLSQTQVYTVEHEPSDGFLKDLTDNLRVGVYISQEGKLVFVNPRFTEELGFTEAELLGTTTLDYAHSEDRERIRRESIKRLNGELSSPYEARFVTKDGEIRVVLETMTSIQYKGRRAALGSHIDITEHRQMENALKESRANFHSIVERSTDGIMIVDKKGVMLFVNKTLESILHRRAEELLGEVFGLPMMSGEMAEVDIVRKSGEPGLGEIAVVETEWEGEPAHLVSLRDITERRKAENELVIKDKAIASAANAICIADFDGNLTYVNPAFLKMWDFDSAAEVLGKSILDFWPEEDHKQDTIKTLYEKRSWHGELVKQRKNGLEFYSQLSISPVIDSDDRPIAIMASFIDLTERRQAEQTQERLNHQLQAQISELEAFSYGIAHDLRSPLVSIEGFSRLLREDMQNQQMENVQEDIRLLESGVRKMQGFLNSTLEYSRSGQMIKPTANVSFGKIVDDVIAEINGQISSIGATFSLANKFPKVHADRNRIIQVLTNLVQNSIKYRDKTVPLKIEIGHYLSKNGPVFFVRDNGIGIDASEAKKVFGLFYRGTAEGEGSGIGLAVVKKIIEAHGGRIWIQEGQSGKGTTMCFTLPQPGDTSKGGNNGKNQDTASR